MFKWILLRPVSSLSTLKREFVNPEAQNGLVIYKQLIKGKKGLNDVERIVFL